MYSTTLEFALPAYLLLLLALICLALLIYPFEDIKDRYEHTEDIEITKLQVLDSSHSPLYTSEINRYLLSFVTLHYVRLHFVMLHLCLFIRTAERNSCASDDSFIDSNENEKTETDTESSVTDVVLSAQSPHNNLTLDIEATGETIPNTDAPSPLEKEKNKRLRRRVSYFLMFLNFSTRGGLSVYETRGTQMMLDQYNMPQWELGLLVSMAGAFCVFYCSCINVFLCMNTFRNGYSELVAIIIFRLHTFPIIQG